MKSLLLLVLFASAYVNDANAQKVGFISSNTIRERFLEAKQSEQRVQSIVDEWKRELAALQSQIDNLEFEIKKNRLIWSDQERQSKDMELQNLKTQREGYAKTKFEPNGEYDGIVKEIMKPIEEKIYAAVQEVAADQGYDIIWDQSTQPLAYVNFKYDITVKVLRKLGVDVDELEKELNKKIDNDPRNKEPEVKKSRRTSRTKKTQTKETEDNKTETDEKIDDRKIERPTDTKTEPAKIETIEPKK